MLRIIKDCRLCGVSVHSGETFPIGDFDEADIQIVVGAGFAERYTPPVKETPETAVESTEDVKTDEDTSAKKTTAKTARKRKK